MRTVAGFRSSALVLLAPLALVACGTVSLYDENDLWAPSDRGDRNYTHGTRLSMVFPVTDPAPADSRPPVESAGAHTETVQVPTRFGSRLADWTAERLPLYDPEKTTHLGFIVGQDLYTPTNTRRRDLIVNDRPYAGWAYLGVLVANVGRRASEDPAGDGVETVEVDVGIVGPHSYGEAVQRFAHRVTDSQQSRGWDNQLHDEVAFVATYDARDRIAALGGSRGLGWDAITSYGGSLGTVLTEARAGITSRFGWDLPRDFGVNTAHSTAVEVPETRGSGGVHAYGFAGVDGHAIARNIFLDGNTFGESHSVNRRPLVLEVRIGVAITLGGLRLAYTAIERSREFDGQDRPQRFGSVALSYTFEF